jgi:dolichol kinase
MIKEISRKIIHFFLIFVPITYHEIGRSHALISFFILAIFITGLDYLRRKSLIIQNIFIKIFGYILKKHEFESNKFCGASFAALAACINFSFFSQEIATTSFAILVFCDGLASISGKTISSKKFFEKSLAGFLTFLIVGFFVLAICGNIFQSNLSFYLIGSFSLFCCAIIEAKPSIFKNIDDNFTVPVSFAIVFWLINLLIINN